MNRKDDIEYQTGFGNALASEARPSALPRLQNSPRDVPFGLYAEQINGTGRDPQICETCKRKLQSIPTILNQAGRLPLTYCRSDVSTERLGRLPSACA